MREHIKQLLTEEIVTVSETKDQNMRRKISSGRVEAVKKGNTWLIDIKDLKKPKQQQ